ncbi:MAG: exodeoxyribonuclease VII large subunit [Candidatus Saccharimonadales bacterium]
MNDVTLTVSEFVAVCNQTLEYAYPNVTITGELANFRVSKNRWVYFDLKDEASTVRFFGTVYQLPGPLQDGMLLAVKGAPRLHPQFGFSVNTLSIKPVGEGAIKKAAALLETKLKSEGLFDPGRKRPLPYPPATVGLITSAESAAFRDFIKILNARWGGVKVQLADVQVQGDPAAGEIVQAIEQFTQLSVQPDVLVVTRGGGSAEDLQTFSTEQVTRAVAASRIPTLVAIGHEADVSLAELAADQRASTPSNAAEMLVPDRKAVRRHVQAQLEHAAQSARQRMAHARQQLQRSSTHILQSVERQVDEANRRLRAKSDLLDAFNPRQALARGYALVRKGGSVVRNGTQLSPGESIDIELADAALQATVKQVTIKT